MRNILFHKEYKYSFVRIIKKELKLVKDTFSLIEEKYPLLVIEIKYNG